MDWRKCDVLGLGVSVDLAETSGSLKCLFSGKGKVDYLNVSGHASQLSRLRYYVPRIAVNVPPVVFHTLNINMMDPDPGGPNTFARTQEIIKFLKPKWVETDLGIWMTPSGVYQDALLLPPILDEASVDAVVQKIILLQEYFKLPFLIENPPFASIPGNMHILEFMSEVSIRSGSGLVLDIGHLLTHEFARGRGLQSSFLQDFPFELVGEVHLAGIEEITTPAGQILLDRHDLPILNDCWEFLEQNLTKMTNLKGITLEQERCDLSLILEHIERARRIICNSKPRNWS